MKLARWIWPVNVAGRTAVANLACVGLLGILHLCLRLAYFPYGYLGLGPSHDWKLAADNFLTVGMFVLAFPMGWIGDIQSDPVLTIAFVPVNAYVWGAFAQIIWSRQILAARSKRLTLTACANENCSVHFAVDIAHCPGCGTRSPAKYQNPPAQLPDPTGDESPPPVKFILVFGVAAPTICGGAALTFLGHFGREAIAAAAVLAGAGFILFSVRWVNRRDVRRALRP